MHTFMEKSGLTNEQLAFAAGISVRHVVYIRRGEREPTRPKMAAILNACRRLANRRRLSITDLFDFEEAAA